MRGKLKSGKRSNFLTKLSKCSNSYFKASVNLTLVKKKRCSVYLMLSPSFLLCSQFRDLISWTQCHPPPPHHFPSSPWHCLFLPFIWFLCHSYMTHQSNLWERMWSLPSGLSPPLGAPVSWGFHQGLGDDASRLLHLASMEATKPQESKRTILRSKSGCGCEAVATLLTVLFLLLVLILYELKVYTCTCEQQSMARVFVFNNLPIPPERWCLHQEPVVPMSALKVVAFFLSWSVTSFLNHSVLELSLLRRAASHSTEH